MTEIERYLQAMQSTSLPDWWKRSLAEAVTDIKSRRAE